MSEDAAMTQTDTRPSTTSTLLDEEWLAAPRRRSRLRVLLAAALAAALCFLGGVEVQQRYGTETTTTSGLPDGFPWGRSEWLPERRRWPARRRAAEWSG